jgi:hypothetical protein
MRNRVWLRVVLSTLVLAGCAVDTPNDPVKSADPLQLSEASKERITGEFTREGLTVKFDSIRTATVFSFEIRAADGRSLIKGEKIEQNFVTTVLDGRLSIFYGDTVETNILHEGDQAALAELEALPEYALLPWLSYELGVRGYTGNDYPSVLALHMFNRAVADRLQIAIPAVELEAPTTFPREEGYCTAPTSNNCYGKCGPGCTCWGFVCGDCCYHYGCAKHDGYCRGSGFWDTAKCVTTWGAAFFGC